MWLAQITLRHNCIIGNRCRKYKCISLGYPLEWYSTQGKIHYLHFEKIIGKKEDVARFLADLKSDPAVTDFEAEKGMVFFTYTCRQKGRMPAQNYHKKIFYVKPIRVDEKGFEHWEIATWNRENLNEFIKQIKKETVGLETFKIEKITQTKLNEIYFPQLLPLLSEGQQKALQLALKEGYYHYPRKIELRDLARMMKISLSTYREHLRKAERKMLDSL